MVKHANIKIYGNVQGVSFRYYTVEAARKYSITGWVKNEPDGTVYIEAEGEENNLKRFIRWCHDGSRAAKVNKVDYEFSDELQGFEEFGIGY